MMPGERFAFCSDRLHQMVSIEMVRKAPERQLSLFDLKPCEFSTEWLVTIVEKPNRVIQRHVFKTLDESLEFYKRYSKQDYRDWHEIRVH